ncbi:MAG: hypothetical protein PWQ55_2282 [Chloroflexota bacterium]|nr:hypothetical protein [Chloroflexota bacterium]
MSLSSLKNRLKKLQTAGNALPQDIDRTALLAKMLEHIGSSDSELRDDLIFFSLQEWIARNPQIPVTDLRATWPRLLDEQHLFFHLGEQGTDSVFTRSFSALTLALYVYRHRQEAYLSSADLRTILAALCRYLSLEQDLRGYVPGPGWAHAVAHSADALDELALCAEMNADDLRRILAAILGSMSRPQAPFVQREEERMATAFVNLHGRGLIPTEELISQFDLTVHNIREHFYAKPFDPQDHSLWNLRNFLRALYFRLKHAGEEELAADLLKLEAALMAPRP